MRNLYLLLLLFSSTLYAQISIDGRYDAATENEYVLLTSTPVGSTGFGTYGIFELRAYNDSDHLYLNVLGTPEANFNKVVIYLDVVSNNNGISAGTTLPAPSSGFFTGVATLDVPNTDFALVYGGGSIPYEGFTNLITYAGGAATDEFQMAAGGVNGSITGDGTPFTLTGGVLDGGQLAYTATNDITTRVGDEALEFEIDLLDLGITANTPIHIFAAYTDGSGNFWSDNTLPAISGLTGNLGGNPDFTAIAGDQFVTYSTQSLPVDYIGFSARTAGKVVRLDWKTATEEDNEGFTIERSTDGNRFSGIGWVSARATGRNGAIYAYTDTDVTEGRTYYYRLRQQDFDGDHAYSSVVTVLTEAAQASVLVYPNPTNAGVTYLRYQSPTDQEITVRVYNTTGQQVSEQQLRAVAGTNDLRLPTANLAPGFYQVRLNDGRSQLTTPLAVR